MNRYFIGPSSSEEQWASAVQRRSYMFLMIVGESGVPATTCQLHTKISFPGWLCVNVWPINETKTFPLILTYLTKSHFHDSGQRRIKSRKPGMKNECSSADLSTDLVFAELVPQKLDFHIRAVKFLPSHPLHVLKFWKKGQNLAHCGGD